MRPPHRPRSPLGRVTLVGAALLGVLLPVAVPAPASAAGDARLVIHPVTSVAKVGSLLTFTVPASTLAALPQGLSGAWVQERFGSTWLLVGNGIGSAPTGEVVGQVKAPATVGTYQFRLVDDYTGSTVVGPTVRVRLVRSTLTVTAKAARHVAVGQPAVVTGVVSPAVRGSVTLQRRVSVSTGPGFLPTWVNVAKAPIAAHGRFTVRAALPPGTWALRTISSASSSRAPGVSHPVVVSVAVPAGVAGLEPSSLWNHQYIPATGLLRYDREPQLTGSVMVKDNAALGADGRVRTWGSNSVGELGAGLDPAATVDLATPTLVGLTGVVGLAAASGNGGGPTLFAVRSDGSLWSWGDNTIKLLGTGTSAAFVSTPHQVPGLSGVLAVATDGLNVFALRSDGTVWGWGDQITQPDADGYPVPTLTPVPVPGMVNVAQVLGRTVLLRDGSVWLFPDMSGVGIPQAPAGSAVTITEVGDATVLLNASGALSYTWGDGVRQLPAAGTVRQLTDGLALNSSGTVLVLQATFAAGPSQTGVKVNRAPGAPTGVVGLCGGPCVLLPFTG